MDINDQVDVADVEEFVQASLAERVESVRAVRALDHRLSDAEALVTSLSVEYAAAYKTARGIGWSDKELAGFGLRERERPRSRRVQKRSAKTKPDVPSGEVGSGGSTPLEGVEPIPNE